MQFAPKVQRVNYLFLAALLVLSSLTGSFVLTSRALAAPGDSPADPIIVEDCDDLQAIGQSGNASKHFKIGDHDIDCSATSGWNSGEGFDPIGTWSIPFSGSLDGNGKTIIGLFINRDEAGTDGYGLFGSIQVQARISNLTLEDVNITGTDRTGGLAGYADPGADIENISVSGVITGDEMVGGAVGFFRGTAAGITFDGTVNGTQTVGGLFGRTEENAEGYDTSDSSSSGKVSGSYQVGGLVGWNDAGIIRSFSAADVDGAGGDEIGGFVGTNNLADIARSYATGQVTGGQYVGGFIGLMGGGVVDESYSSSDVDGSLYNVGGFVGQIYVGEISNSYATGNVASGQSNAGGFAGDIEGGTLHKNYATGTVTIPEDGDQYAGAFAGEALGSYDAVEIRLNFAAGAVSAPSGEGGFIALLTDVEEMEFNDNFFDVIRTGVDACTAAGGAVIGCTGVNSEGSPSGEYFFNTSSSSPLDQWDFEDVWKLQANSYPCLLWQDTATCPGATAGSGTDGDGAPDAGEDAGPNNGDANGDNIPDSQQDYVASFVSPITGKYVALETTNDCSITAVSMQAEDAAAKDSGFDYPDGLMNFTLQCGTPGTTATVSQYYFDAAQSGFTLRKYIPATHAYFTITDASMTSGKWLGRDAVIVTYTIEDGGALDLDGAVDGTIIDPAGLGQSIVGAPNTGLGGGER